MRIKQELQGLFHACSYLALLLIINIGIFVEPNYAVEIEYYQNILDRGYLKVGIPPYDTQIEWKG